MKKYQVNKGTKIYVQGKGEHVLGKTIILFYEVTEPLHAFPQYVLVTRANIRRSKFYRSKPTRMFIAGEDVWQEHPHHILAVHEEDLHDYR